MPVYERETVVDAPFDEVWDFHSRASGLVAVTPDWLHLRIESVERPSGGGIPVGDERAVGETDPDLLETGTKIRASIRPFGVGPRQRWTSSVVTRREADGRGILTDEMVRGPFPHWNHAHRFEAVDGGTRVRDRVEFRLPGGPLGRVLAPAGRVGFEPLFRYRHRRTKALLE